MKIIKILSLLLIVPLALMGCGLSTATGQQQAWESRTVNRAKALDAAVNMPDASLYTQQDFDWQDDKRSRSVPVRLYLPAKQENKAPLLVFSHGLGGSRQGYSYIGKYLAANGIASLHLQHVGSDSQLWFGNAVQLVSRLQEAARETEAIARAQDLSFALDRLLAMPEMAAKMDTQSIAAAGHSYGANTTLLVSGARVLREGKTLSLMDPRIKAAIVISAPPFYGENDLSPIVGSIAVPSLHITSTGDEINVPGYFSSAEDRVKVYEATAQTGKKMLAVFKAGSHSMFTDRLNTGGQELNPQVKKATRELILAFLQQEFAGNAMNLRAWPTQYAGLIARYDDKLLPH